jgi:hypothetical protein
MFVNPDKVVSVGLLLIRRLLVLATVLAVFSGLIRDFPLRPDELL